MAPWEFTDIIEEGFKSLTEDHMKVLQKFALENNLIIRDNYFGIGTLKLDLEDVGIAKKESYFVELKNNFNDHNVEIIGTYIKEKQKAHKDSLKKETQRLLQEAVDRGRDKPKG